MRDRRGGSLLRSPTLYGQKRVWSELAGWGRGTSPRLSWVRNSDQWWEGPGAGARRVVRCPGGGSQAPPTCWPAGSAASATTPPLRGQQGQRGNQGWLVPTVAQCPLWGQRLHLPPGALAIRVQRQARLGGRCWRGRFWGTVFSPGQAAGEAQPGRAPGRCGSQSPPEPRGAAGIQGPTGPTRPRAVSRPGSWVGGCEGGPHVEVVAAKGARPPPREPPR